MKKFWLTCGCIGALLTGDAVMAVSAGTVANDSARALVYTNSSGVSTAGSRGQKGIASAYIQNQRNTYFLITQPDVDTACRRKIMNCLSDYCGDSTAVPGKTSSRCMYATETELYNYALLCLQKDTSILLPQYNTMTRNGAGGMNTAARLCPSYVQQELMSYLSMANMADKLTKSHSDLCVQRRRELEAAMACHSVALAYGNETASMLTTQLNDYCGSGVAGGSAEMVTRFVNAGNVGANVWGWAEKIVSLDLNNKGANWESAVDAVLASYTNRMNLACGDDLQLNTVSHPTTTNTTPNLQNAVSLVANVAFPTVQNNKQNPYEDQSVFMEVTSMSELYDYASANQVVQAGLTNSSLTQNSFLTSTQMDQMQKAYKRGTKVFIIRDSTRCYIVPVTTLTQMETSLVANAFANCVSR
ncbi:MAG: hypothetical protein II843_00975 [Alphaproteobacteria bacterium]|nr:hypothetical protein [Alphaproteobacteria bacterium]MBQ6012137.1 hypothetical protein [Alphaproteobacteria bacterium]